MAIFADDEGSLRYNLFRAGADYAAEVSCRFSAFMASATCPLVKCVYRALMAIVLCPSTSWITFKLALLAAKREPAV